MGGMFVWIKVPAIDDTLELTMDKLVPNGVFAIPGNAFNYNDALPDQHIRLSYSFATSDEVEKVINKPLIKPNMLVYRTDSRQQIIECNPVDLCFRDCR